jgi:hypothetical protein
MSEDTKNAKLVDTMLGYEDHGILTFYITVDFGGSGQAFGGYALDAPPRDRTGTLRVATKGAGIIIASLLHTLDVPCWEKLKGQIVRVRGDYNRITAIGHALRDRWCVPAELFAQSYEEATR